MNDPTALGIRVPGNESAATPDTRIRRFCAAEITVLPDDDPQPFYVVQHDQTVTLPMRAVRDDRLSPDSIRLCEETSSGVISISEVHV